MRAAREGAKLKPEEVALRMGMGLRGYQKYEYGESTPTLERLQQFADIVKVPIDTLIADRSYEFNPVGDPIRLYKVPILHEIPASGFILGFDDIEIDGYTMTTVAYDGAFALRVKGDCMSPKIEEGDIVICVPDMPFENGKVYAVIDENSQHTLKNVQKINGGYMLIPTNQKYEALFIRDMDMVKLYRVVKVERNM